MFKREMMKKPEPDLNTPLLLKEVDQPKGDSDGIRRRYGKYLCSNCHLNTYVCRMDSPSKFCDDCRTEIVAERRKEPEAGRQYRRLKFLWLLPTEPPLYRNFGKFECSCGAVIEAEVRRVASGERWKCSRTCKGPDPKPHRRESDAAAS